MIRSFLLLAVAVMMTACGSSASRDGVPQRAIAPHEVKDAVPRREPITKAGNKSPYTVLGKRYYVLDTAAGYRKRGIASWYGRKFHGRNTSNGEVFDAYKATAAHRSLPIPSYVRVTNLDNNRSMVVRVNDRGPFHDDRIIDLSYGAALKLGFAAQGTAPVLLEVVSANGGTAPDVPARYNYVQAGAFSALSAANSLRDSLSRSMRWPVTVSTVKIRRQSIYRVRIGPLTSGSEVLAAQDALEQAGHGRGQPVP